MTRRAKEPIESVELTISIKANRAMSEKIKALIPSARVRSGTCEVRLAGERPADVAQRAEETMEKLRDVLGAPKDFKNAERSQVKK